MTSGRCCSELFIFGEGEDQLTLGSGTSDPDNPDSIRIHGDHFVPAAVASNGTVILFLTNSIGQQRGQRTSELHQRRLHLQSFEGGAPTLTSTSAGPIFGERAQTLGKGRLLAGLSHTGLNFKTLRGVDLANLRQKLHRCELRLPGLRLGGRR